MDVAGVISDAGTCSRLQVGAVIVRDRRIISTGYNGAPKGMPHCDHSNPDDLRFTTIMGGCVVSVHAEANAICYAAKTGIATDKASLYTTDAPCQKCAELIVNAGIIEVIYGREYRIRDGLDLLKAARVHVTSIEQSSLHFMPPAPGHGPSVHPSQQSDPSFEEGWTAAADAHRRGGPRV
jgi:dCMP deaminase